MLIFHTFWACHLLIVDPYLDDHFDADPDPQHWYFVRRSVDPLNLKGCVADLELFPDPDPAYQIIWIHAYTYTHPYSPI